MSIVKAGTYLLLTSGAYSGYGVQALLRVTKDFDVDVLKAHYLARHPRQAEPYRGNTTQFVKKEIVPLTEEIEHVELHLGDYGTLSPRIIPTQDEWREW